MVWDLLTVLYYLGISHEALLRPCCPAHVLVCFTVADQFKAAVLRCAASSAALLRSVTAALGLCAVKFS